MVVDPWRSILHAILYKFKKNVDGRNVVLSIKTPSLQNVLHDLTIWVTRRLSSKREKLLTLREHIGSPLFYVGGVRRTVLISLVFCILWFVLCFACIRFVSSICVHSRYPATIAATHLNNVWNQNYDSVQRRKHCVTRAKYKNAEERCIEGRLISKLWSVGAVILFIRVVPCRHAAKDGCGNVIVSCEQMHSSLNVLGIRTRHTSCWLNKCMVVQKIKK